jgi:hypothetical protein
VFYLKQRQVVRIVDDFHSGTEKYLAVAGIHILPGSKKTLVANAQPYVRDCLNYALRGRVNIPPAIVTQTEQYVRGEMDRGEGAVSDLMKYVDSANYCCGFPLDSFSKGGPVDLDGLSREFVKYWYNRNFNTHRLPAAKNRDRYLKELMDVVSRLEKNGGESLQPLHRAALFSGWVDVVPQGSLFASPVIQLQFPALVRSLGSLENM